ILAGINHRTAPVAVLERFSRTPDAQRSLLVPVTASGPRFFEAAILATCNRVEAYAVVDHPEAAARVVLDRFAAAASVPRDELGEAPYTALDEDAVRHLFEVAAGLDSMVVGEWQILSQVGDAYANARRAGAAGVVLRALFRAAVASGRRARMASGVGREAASIGSAAVALAEGELGPLAERRAVLIGSGQMAELVADALRVRGVRGTRVVNRHPERARPIARALGGEALDFLHLERTLVEADFAVSATGAPHAILLRETLERVMAARGGRPLLLLDIALPRDVDPAAAALPGVRLHDLGTLQAFAGAHAAADAAELAAARERVAAEAARFAQWFRSARATPMLLALRQRAELIRERELERALRRLPALDAHERETVALLTQTLVNRLLREPTLRLREEAERGEGPLAGAVGRLFSLEEAAG
ncbi:MAG TPA: glutamyl-tRNA reductase, partial [Gemmatimonadota bacterium]